KSIIYKIVDFQGNEEVGKVMLQDMKKQSVILDITGIMWQRNTTQEKEIVHTNTIQKNEILPIKEEKKEEIIKEPIKEEIEKNTKEKDIIKEVIVETEKQVVPPLSNKIVEKPIVSPILPTHTKEKVNQ